MEISFIIPTYNSSLFIGKCLDSIFSQHLTIKDYEVIVVDDGSSDNTVGILEIYKEKYKNFRYFKQKNSGPGVARSLGIKEAQGYYIQFVDSDDYLLEYDFKRIFSELKKNRLDILFFNSYKDVNGNLAKKNELSKNVCNKLMSGLEYINSNNFICSPVMYLVKRDFLILNNLFYSNRRGAEDIDHTIKMICEAERVMYINDAYYAICERDDSLSHTPSLSFQYAFLDSIYESISYIHSIVKDTNEKSYKTLCNYCLNLYRMHNDSVSQFKLNDILKFYIKTKSLNKKIYKCIKYGTDFNKYKTLIYLRAYMPYLLWLFSCLKRFIK